MTGLCPIHNLMILIIPKQGIEMQFLPKQAVEIHSKNGHLTVMLHSTTPPPLLVGDQESQRQSTMPLFLFLPISFSSKKQIRLELVEKFRLKIPKFLFFCIIFSYS